MSWITIVFMMLMFSPWISPGKSHKIEKKTLSQLNDCVVKTKQHFVVPDKFNGIITARKFLTNGTGCIILLKKDTTAKQLPATLEKQWLQMMTKDGDDQLYISKWHIKNKLQLVINRTRCRTPEVECRPTLLDTDNLCKNRLYEKNCTTMFPMVQDRYIIILSAQNEYCLNCNRPVKKPDAEYKMTIITKATEEEGLNPAKAVEVMNRLSDFATSMNVTSAEFKLGGGVSGVVVKGTDPMDLDHVALAYVTPDASPNIIDSAEDLDSDINMSRYISVPKEAFEKSLLSNVNVTFIAVCRFNNMTKDEKNSIVLGNEVFAIEMGTTINNLTDKINISVQNMKYEGIPSCHSWNGQGSKPNWTDEGCVTLLSGDWITCQCSHLTFFSILLASPNETISSFDLNNLTIITEVGCGLSMLFLSAVLFMHFLLRQSKGSNSITILIHMVVAIFLLDLIFLINQHVERLDNLVGCKIMAAVMHYFLLSTFTWFAVQALHLCLQMNMRGKVNIRHYILKVSISSWGLPVVVVAVLLSVGKYGAQDITTSDTKEKVTLCWITDNVVQWTVNIGYYALVFLFTLTAFIIISSQLLCTAKMGSALIGRNGTRITIVLGLCCIQGIAWGFIFFAHGVLRIPAYYIFTVLSSFQGDGPEIFLNYCHTTALSGFFIFIYYYKTRHQREIDDESGNENTNTSSTVSSKVTSTSMENFDNPYINLPGRQ